MKKLFCLFEIGAVLLASFAAQPTGSAAADNTAKTGRQTAPTGALPAVGTYKIDPDHSFAYFGAWHHVVGLVRGRFDKVTGTITVAPDLTACGVDVTVAAYSISTQNSERDNDLRGPDFFDVTRFPTMTYRGRGIRRISESSWILEGALTRIRAYPQIELIWASPREVFNIVQADAIGCHIITVTHDLLKKLPLLGRDLTEYSLDTVKMFSDDARAAGLTLNTPVSV